VNLLVVSDGIYGLKKPINLSFSPVIRIFKPFEMRDFSATINSRIMFTRVHSSFSRWVSLCYNFDYPVLGKTLPLIESV
jgi:hypothetical protein